MSLTTDVWSDPDLAGFLAATAHFIVRMLDGSDSRLILRSGLLAFRHVHGSHTGENLAHVLHKVIKDAGIEQRVHQFHTILLLTDHTMLHVRLEQLLQTMQVTMTQ